MGVVGDATKSTVTRLAVAASALLLVATSALVLHEPTVRTIDLPETSSSSPAASR
jgi:hypothetical protein